MKNLLLEDHIIGIAEILKVSEIEVAKIIHDHFINSSTKEIDEILDDAYWEFVNTNTDNIQKHE